MCWDGSVPGTPLYGSYYVPQHPPPPTDDSLPTGNFDVVAVPHNNLDNVFDGDIKEPISVIEPGSAYYVACALPLSQPIQRTHDPGFSLDVDAHSESFLVGFREGVVHVVVNTDDKLPEVASDLYAELMRMGHYG